MPVFASGALIVQEGLLFPYLAGRSSCAISMRGARGRMRSRTASGCRSRPPRCCIPTPTARARCRNASASRAHRARGHARLRRRLRRVRDPDRAQDWSVGEAWPLPRRQAGMATASSCWGRPRHGGAMGECVDDSPRRGGVRARADGRVGLGAPRGGTSPVPAEFRGGTTGRDRKGAVAGGAASDAGGERGASGGRAGALDGWTAPAGAHPGAGAALAGRPAATGSARFGAARAGHGAPANGAGAGCPRIGARVT